MRISEGSVIKTMSYYMQNKLTYENKVLNVTRRLLIEVTDLAKQQKTNMYI